ncbi:hypothetical protein K1719_028778 [Acacia pycnantha]|nr:hypothetical protein K1719_028778 [Acacia pycnantha]
MKSAFKLQRNIFQVFDLGEEAPDKVLRRIYANFENFKLQDDQFAMKTMEKLKLIGEMELQAGCFKNCLYGAALVSNYVGYLEKGQIPPNHIPLVHSQVSLNIEGSKYTVTIVIGISFMELHLTTFLICWHHLVMVTSMEMKKDSIVQRLRHAISVMSLLSFNTKFELQSLLMLHVYSTILILAEELSREERDKDMEELLAKQEEISKRDKDIKLLEAVIQTLGGKESHAASE